MLRSSAGSRITYSLPSPVSPPEEEEEEEEPIVHLAFGETGGDTRVVAWATTGIPPAASRPVVRYGKAADPMSAWTTLTANTTVLGRYAKHHATLTGLAKDPGGAFAYQCGWSDAGGAFNASAPLSRVRPFTAPRADTEAVLGLLMQVIQSRKGGDPTDSWTARLLDKGVDAISDKITEESAELVRALSSESDVQVVKESADLLYHVMVGLASRGLDMEAVTDELSRRFGVSGVAEKASRR